MILAYFTNLPSYRKYSHYLYLFIDCAPYHQNSFLNHILSHLLAPPHFLPLHRVWCLAFWHLWLHVLHAYGSLRFCFQGWWSSETGWDRGIEMIGALGMCRLPRRCKERRFGNTWYFCLNLLSIESRRICLLESAHPGQDLPQINLQLHFFFPVHPGSCICYFDFYRSRCRQL